MLTYYISIVYRQKNRFEWNKFRAISRLEKKFDETMTEYYKAFVAMCKRVSCMKLTEEEGELMFAQICKAKSTLHCENAVNWRLSVRLECQRIHFVDNLRNSLNKALTHKYKNIYLYYG